MKLYHALLQLLFPDKCILCGKVLHKEEQDLCRKCRTSVPEYPESKETLQFLDSFTAVWYYEGNVRRSLLRYKFYNARSLSRGYGHLLAEKVRREYPVGFDCITWVPVSARRKRERGYDQVELLAKVVGKELARDPVPLLKKVRHNRPHSGISGVKERRANALDAYREINPEAIAGKRILLLDDIITTGATAGECAKVLRKHGAIEVHCAAVAAARK